MTGMLREPKVFETTSANFTANAIIGEGGCGLVYKATDDSGRACAVKLLDPAKATREKRKRFQNELSFCLKNQHRNIITVIDHGVFRDEKGAAPFYVMPLYDGSLRTCLVAGMPASRAIAYVAQILDGVEAAHFRGVVHRDLKPENILYDQAADRLLVADFGAAHFQEEQLYTTVETAPHSRLANFQYAAPEQRHSGSQVDSRADIYALGLMLNEMFTGKVPQGTGYKGIGSVAPEYGYLDDLVTEMLRQSPTERPASIEVVKQQLIGRKNEFVTRQRLSELKGAVVPVTDLDDPLLADPPRLVNFDYDRGTLTLVFQRPVNQKWVAALKNMGSHTSLLRKGPEYFSIKGDKATIDAEERDVQRIIDYFKSWLPLANRRYEETIRQEKRQAEEQERQRMQRETEDQERRLRVLRNAKL